jgi:nitronate monooxygenase
MECTPSSGGARRDGIRRREALKAGLAAVTLSSAAAPPEEAPSLRTALCDLLGIELPVLQAPMAGVVTPALVAAVSNAGGLGILPGIGLPPDELRRQIRAVRALTTRPFGVNLLLHPDIRQPPDPASAPPERARAAAEFLGRTRAALGLPAVDALPPRPPALADAAFEVVVEARVPVFSVGLGVPTADMVARCRALGTRVIAMAATVPDARTLAAAGVDAVIAQGGEAGGHRSTWVKREGPDRAVIGTLALVPQVVDAVRVPVVAAGGIADGRQLAAALALGAAGVLLGTRFVACAESAAPAFYRDALVAADSDSTVVSDAFTGLYARFLRTPFLDEHAAAGAPTFPPLVQQAAVADITAAARARGDGAHYPQYAGQGVGMIRDVPRAADIVHAIAREARGSLGALATLAAGAPRR